MGAEAKCCVRVAGERFEGKALLETDELLFRGGVRLKLPFSAIRRASAAGGVLEVDCEHANGTISFDLGSAAERWAERIRSPRSVLDKLGVKAGQVVSVVAIADDSFLRDVQARAGRVSLGRLASKSDIVFLGATTSKDLARIARAATKITPSGAIWVVHPKGPGALRDTEIFAAAKQAGLTYTKVVRFSETHTAEKLVIPLARR